MMNEVKAKIINKMIDVLSTYNNNDKICFKSVKERDEARTPTRQAMVEAMTLLIFTIIELNTFDKIRLLFLTGKDSLSNLHL